MPEIERATVSVWSDYVCPFCRLEQPVLDALEEEFGDRVGIEWRAFELRPEPVPTLDPDGAYLHNIWDASVYPMAERRGVTLRLPPVQPRSRLALEAADHARDHDRFPEMHDALFRAFFEEGRDIGDPDVLVDIGASVGLDAEGLRTSLDQGLHTGRVVGDERIAAELEISGVPSMLIRAEGAPLDSGELLTGAQPLDLVRAAVQRALAGESRARRSRPTFRRGLPTLEG